MGRICVIGGANIDIVGSSIESLRYYDSNPGTISISYGGVGRNIAQILALLGENVSLVTCFSDDSYGTMMRQDCENLGIDTSLSIISHEAPSSMYIAMLDSDRDMKVAMSDMRILREMTPAFLEPVLRSLSDDDMIIIDANLDLKCIACILEKAPCRIAADPVSVSKASRLKDGLSSISVFKPNKYEAQSLSGIEIHDRESAAECLDWFLKQGIDEIIISMAEGGVLAADREGKYWYTHRMILVENATGGGDAFLGAYTAKRLHRVPMKDAVRFAVSAAVTTIEQDAVRRRELSTENVEAAVRDMDIRETIL